MTKTNRIAFADIRRLLQGLGYKEKRADNARVFYRSKNDMVIFRRYDDQDNVRSGDVLSTRQYLDLRGVLCEAEFDAFLANATTSA